MKTKQCPTCKGTGRIEIKTMDKNQMRTDLNKGVIHWAQHGLNKLHLNNQMLIIECFNKIQEYAGQVLEELDKEEPEPPKPPKLRVKEGGFYYFNDGTKPIVLIGAFPRQLLHVIKGYAGAIPWVSDMYIAEAKESGINYVRLNVVDDYDLTYSFAKDMESRNIIVEYTMAQRDDRYFGDYKKHIQKLKPLNNIIIEVWTEFCRKEFIQEDIDRALKIADYALAEGMIVSGGAWGLSQTGKAMSEAFRLRFQGQIWTIHRPYPPRHLLETAVDEALDAGFAVSWNEILISRGVEPDELEVYTRALADRRVSVMLYLNCEKYFDLMGRLCKEYNNA